ncbi:RING finger and CHY zinc finger domain-containing protein 1 isoform X2 [Jatropha curcas]|uniref:RING finger and CHY zinc finger domain-containing protein 1 isoform X2 n=1 Tax=Jatropha curcas TaxID=180498 RepID=UPI0018950D84|nr:RING finger and CHY zinc finger domain-containing protein 1 isoform X2 [Jatropha curcas]
MAGPVRLNEEDLRKFNEFNQTASEDVRRLLGESSSCCICLELFSVGQTVHYILPCKHFLHSTCGVEYFKTEMESKCPYCQQVIGDVSEMDIEPCDAPVPKNTENNPPGNPPTQSQ